MEGSGAVTFEAKMLNVTRDTGADPSDRVDDIEERRLLREWLPNGRILDERDLALVMDQGEVWAPFNVRRQMLMEYGRAAVGQRMVLTSAELDALRKWVKRVSDSYTDRISASAHGEQSPIEGFEGLRGV